MRLILESTNRIITIEKNGVRVPARIWEGVSDPTGIKVYALITRVAVRSDHDCAEFERELLEQPQPPASAESAVAIPNRFVLPD